MAAGRVELVVQAVAEDRITATLKSTSKGLDQLREKLKDQEEGAGKATTKFGKFTEGLSGIVGFAGKLGLLGAAAGVAYRAVGELGEALDVVAGAKAADQFDVMTKSVRGFESIVAQAKESTAGMIPEGEIIRGAALFKSFGLDVNQLPKALEQVSKTAVRTGEDAKFLASSLVTGISRMSPMILDNLGLTVKLSDANARAAEMFGKTADALEDQEKKAGMLALALDQLAKANEPVDLTNSRTASLERLSAGWENLKGSIQSHLADAAVAVLDWFTTSDEKTKILVNDIREVSPALHEMQAAARQSFDSYIASVQRAIDRTRVLQEIQLETGKRLAEGDADRIAAAEQDARAKAAEQYDAEQIERVQAIARLVESRLITEEEAAKRIKAIEEERARVVKQAGDASRRVTFDALQAEAAQRAAQEAKNKALAEEIKAQTEINEMLKGRGPLLLELGRVQAKLAQAEGLSAEERLTLLQDESRLIVEAKREQDALYKVKAGGLRAEGELIGSNLRLQKAQLEAQVSLTEEQRRSAAMLAWEIRLQEIDADLRARKVTAARAEYETKLADLALQKELAKLEKESTAAAEKAAAKEAEKVASLQTELALMGARNESERELIRLQAEMDRLLASSGPMVSESESLQLQILAERIGAVHREMENAKLADSFREVGDSLSYAFDKIGQFNAELPAVGTAIQDITKVWGDYATGQTGVQDAIVGTLGVLGPATAQFVEDTKTKAAIMAAFEAAQAVASYPNVPAMIAHGAAAAMFGLVAGGVIPSTATPKGAATPKMPTPERQREPGGSGGQRTVVVNINGGLSTAQDVAWAVRKALSSTEGTGRESARW